MKNIKLVIVLDRSGSMSNAWDDTLGGLNHFLDEQDDTGKKLNEKTDVTLISFDDKYESHYIDTPISNVKAISKAEIYPRGTTALYDAVGRAISITKEKIGSKRAKPRVLFVVITDGQNNASREYTAEQIKKTISDLEKEDNWTFVMMGAEIDAWSGASGIGFANKSNTVAYDKVETISAFANLSHSTTNFRGLAASKSTDFYGVANGS